MPDPTFIPAATAPNHTSMSLFWRGSSADEWKPVATIDGSIVPPDPTIWVEAQSVSHGETISVQADTRARPTCAWNAYDYAPKGATTPRTIDFVTGVGLGGALTPSTASEVPVDSRIRLMDLMWVWEARSIGAVKVMRTAYAVAAVPAAIAGANTGTTRAWTGTVYGIVEDSTS